MPERISGINIPNVLQRLRNGDVSAYEPLDSYFRPRFGRFFGTRLPHQAADLTQITLMKIYSGIPNFDPAIGSGDVDKDFRSWAFSIAINTLNMELRGMMKERARALSPIVERVPSPESNLASEQPPTIQDTMPQILGGLSQVLAPRQMEVFERRMAGMRNGAIAADLGREIGWVRSTLNRARQNVENKLLLPAGVKHVSSYDQKGKTTLMHAAVSGRLQAIQFCGRWYTTDGWVAQYAPRQKAVDNNFLEEGYVLLSQATSRAEYGTITGSRHRHLLTKNEGFLYIKPEQLEEFRRTHRKAHKRYPSPGPEYVPVTDLAETQYDYRQILGDVKAGRLTAVQNGRWWFVKPEDYEVYRASQGERVTPSLPYKEEGTGSVRIHGNRGTIYEAQRGVTTEIGNPNHFEGWFFTIAKAATAHKLPFGKQPEEVQDPERHTTAFRDLIGWLKSRNIELSPFEERFLRVRIRGLLSFAEIAQELHMKENVISRHNGIVRKKIEEGLLFPLGIQRLADYKDPSISPAAIFGRVDAVNFLGLWYSTQEKVDEYKTRIFQKMLKQKL